MLAMLLTGAAALLVGAASDDALAPWASNHHPTDVAKQHVQEITEGPAEYVVDQGGTMDGRNCRSPQGVWQPFQQTWESNRSVRMENVGDADVVNPWLSNGRNDFRNLDQIVARAIEPGMTDKEKAMALWWQEIQHRFHLEGDNDELGDPVKVFNVYGYNTCGNDSICLAGQWRKAGLKVAPARLVGHCVTQVFYDDAWHLMDGDMHSIYLLRDNETVAGEQDLVRDHDLIRRTHTQGLLQSETRAGTSGNPPSMCSRGRSPATATQPSTAMNMTLRPDEALVWRWGHRPGQVSRSPAAQVPRTALQWTVGIPARLHQPRRGEGSHALSSRSGRDRMGSAAEEGKPGVVVWTMRSPYVFVGGRLEVEGTGAKFALSWDGQSWHEVDRNLDGLFPPEGPGSLRVLPQVRALGRRAAPHGSGSSTTSRWPRSLFPAWGSARTRSSTPTIAASKRRVRITHQWVERSASRPPGPPSRAGLSPRRRSGQRDRDRFPVAARRRSRWRRDRRLPFRALRTSRHEVAPLHELRQAHLPDARRGPGALHSARARPLESRHRSTSGGSGPRMTRGSGDRGAQHGASHREAPHRHGKSPSNSTASATGESSAGRPTRRVANRWRTAFMPATRRGSLSATSPTR